MHVCEIFIIFINYIFIYFLCVCGVCFHQAKGHADRIETLKPMFVEPKGKGTFNEVGFIQYMIFLY